MADFVSVAVEHLGVVNVAAGVKEAALAGVTRVCGAVNANEDLVVGVHFLLLREHVVAKGPEAHDAGDHAENLEEGHVVLVVRM